MEYRPGSELANADGLSRQCGQYLRPDCPVTPPDVGIVESGFTSELAERDQSPVRRIGNGGLHGQGFDPGTVG